MRAQLRTTDTMAFPVLMSSANETAKTVESETAPAVVTLHTLRNEDGSVAAGTVFFDVNYRMPGATTFTGLHIHDAPAGVNGGITIPMVPTFDPNFTSDTGFGNYWNYTPGVLNLAILDDITQNPEYHYVNIHTSKDPGGVARAQLAPAISRAPERSAAVISANNDKTATTVAPGGLISIYGTNLAKVATDLSGWQGRTLPFDLQWRERHHRRQARGDPLRLEHPDQRSGSRGCAPGAQTVVVNNGVGPSASFNVTVAAAGSRDLLLAGCRGPEECRFLAGERLEPGEDAATWSWSMPPVSARPLRRSPPAAWFRRLHCEDHCRDRHGRRSECDRSLLDRGPGFAGLYQVAITIPPGVSGSVPVVLTQGTAKSNTVNINVQ